MTTSLAAPLTDRSAGLFEGRLHDGADGAGATSAFGATAEAGMDLGRGARAIGIAIEARTHGAVR